MTKFEAFAKEKQYLLGVSPATLEWYEQSLRWLNIESPTEQELKDAVLRMRTAGLKPSSCNSRIRAINSYLTWLKSPHRIPRLKEPIRTLPTFSAQDIQRFLSWKPKTSTQRRLRCLLLMLADTGARIGEDLSLRWSDVDWDSMLLILHGKGANDIHVLASDLPASPLTVLTQFVQLKVYILPLVQRGNTAIKGNTYVG
ncbi:MAG TPA: tyrosine-type recombinase/integrase [Candidatus Sulfotelmatobacter sp.]|nr:tyrosine-type recombinase/integrase [Candidatus Sulfotelmatobacter sp.]